MHVNWFDVVADITSPGDGKMYLCISIVSVKVSPPVILNTGNFAHSKANVSEITYIIPLVVPINITSLAYDIHSPSFIPSLMHSTSTGL